MRVFIADDSVLVRERLNDLLLNVPTVEVVGQAGNKDEALRLIPDCKPDVVILDIRMPGANGIEVLKIIKTLYPSFVVIMLSNYPYPQYREKCMKEGADYFFDKSTEFKKVAEVLGNMIAENHRNKSDLNQTVITE